MGGGPRTAGMGGYCCLRRLWCPRTACTLLGAQEACRWRVGSLESVHEDRPVSHPRGGNAKLKSTCSDVAFTMFPSEAIHVALFLKMSGW